MLLLFLSAGCIGWFITNTNIVCDNKSINTYMILNFGQDNILIFSAYKNNNKKTASVIAILLK